MIMMRTREKKRKEKETNEGRGVVDTITDKGDNVATELEVLDLGGLVFRKDLSVDLIDADFRGDGTGSEFVVASDHDTGDASSLEG